MANYLLKNKTPFTLLTVFAAIVLIIIDGMVETTANTPIQWLIFILAFIFCLYLQFSDINDTITDEEYYPPQHGGFEKVDQPAGEIAWRDAWNNTVDDSQSVILKTKPEHNIKSVIDEPTKTLFEGHKISGKPVFIVQPMMVVSEEEFNQKTNKNLNMKPQDNKSDKPTLEEGPKKIIPIVGYTLNAVPQKYRAMVDDISSFATRGEKKTIAEIEAKIRVFGHPFKKDYPERGVIAFKFHFIRIPAEGYFGIKE